MLTQPEKDKVTDFVAEAIAADDLEELQRRAALGELLPVQRQIIEAMAKQQKISMEDMTHKISMSYWN